MQEITIGMSIVVWRGSSLEIKIGVGFMMKPPLKSSPNDKMLPSFKRGTTYLLKPTHKSWNHYFVILWEALQFEVVVP